MIYKNLEDELADMADESVIRRYEIEVWITIKESSCVTYVTKVWRERV